MLPFTALSLVIAAAAAGFLVFNFPQAVQNPLLLASGAVGPGA